MPRPDEDGPEAADRDARRTLRRVLDAAIASCDPPRILAPHLPDKPVGRCVVVGAGKAAASMAAAVEAAWPDVDLSGLVVTRYGHGAPTRRIEVMEAGHPTPDVQSERAARRMLAQIATLRAEDLVLALISGGGSALMALPIDGLTLSDKQAVTRTLLACGAAIGEINVVRKHLSAIKGGRLAAAAAPARVVTLAISDVPGDDPGLIASGPTFPETSTRDEALAIVARHGVGLPEAGLASLRRAAGETGRVTPDVDFRLIATPARALAAAADAARACGLQPIVLGDALEGESRDLGEAHARVARDLRRRRRLGAPARIVLSGGETTVSLGRGAAGRGGRNMEYLLALTLSLRGEAGIWGLAADTDGIDGSEDAAGAVMTPDTLARAAAAGWDPAAVLAEHDSYSLFDALGDLIRTGPTRTNVNDVRAILVR